MIRFLVAVLALVGLSACTPTTTTTIVDGNSYAEAECFSGPHVLDLSLSVPAQYGPIAELTQYANGPNGLEMSCNLIGFGYPLTSSAYPIYLGEVYGGTAGLCVSALTVNSGRVLSCASDAEVRRAIAAPLGTSGSVIRLTRWQPFPST